MTMTTDQSGSIPVLTTESPDQTTHPTSLGSSMALALDGVQKEAPVAAPTFSGADKHSAARQRAAGDYLVEPERVNILWFAQKHPAPWMRWVYMTAEIAGYLLREHNIDNRPLRPGRVEYYKKIMAANHWRLTHQGVAMDTEGVLQDGQHRLAAVVDASNEMDEDLEVAMPFFVGMDPKNFAAIDENLNRTPVDLFSKGGIKYGSAITTVIRLAMAFNEQSPRKLLREKQPNEAILAYYAEHDSELMQDAARFGSSNAKKVKCPPGPLATAYYLLKEACGRDNAYVEAFLDGLAHGVKSGTRTMLDDDDPRQTARNYFDRVRDEKRRLVGIDAVSIIVLAWNNTVQGLSPRHIRFADNAPIPRIMLCDSDGPSKSAVPSALRGEIGGNA